MSMRWPLVINAAQVPTCILNAVDAAFVHAGNAGPANSQISKTTPTGRIVLAASAPMIVLYAGRFAACGARPGKHASGHVQSVGYDHARLAHPRCIVATSAGTNIVDYASPQVTTNLARGSAAENHK